VSDHRKSVFEWARIYAGDPTSYEARHHAIFDFLRDDGMQPSSRVLEIGCGPLGLGRHLINWLEPGNYCALEPNGWQVEAALDEFFGDAPDYPCNSSFLYRDDFLAVNQEQFDFVVAHSVLSHAAHWQMEQCLSNVRKVVRDGAVFLASLRLAATDSFARQWEYPGVTHFCFPTLTTLGVHFGWTVEHDESLRGRMLDVAPNDSHNWIRFRATLTAAEVNEVRLSDEERRRELAEIYKWAEAEYERHKRRQLGELELS
jgi:SAM-dependent methyltransferase